MLLQPDGSVITARGLPALFWVAVLATAPIWP
jgi:hypothetical protein